MPRNYNESKLTPCPDCGKLGLTRYTNHYTNGKNELKIRCKECNSFWVGDDSKRISEMIDYNYTHNKQIKKGLVKLKTDFTKFGLPGPIILDPDGI